MVFILHFFTIHNFLDSLSVYVRLVHSVNLPEIILTRSISFFENGKHPMEE